MQLQQSCYQAIEVKEPAVKKSSRVKKPENQKAEKGCQENITIFNLTAFVMFKSFLKTKSVDFIQVFKRMRGG